MNCENDDPVERHYLDKDSDDLDSSFNSNSIYRHSYYETKLKAAEALDLKGHEILVDIGCGQGHLMRLLHEFHSNLEEIGIDINLTDLKKAKRRNNDHSSEFILSDASHLPFKNICFDRVVCTAVLEHVTNEKEVLDEIWRVLKEKENAVIDVPGAYHLQNKLSDLFIRKHGVFPFHREYTTGRMKTIVKDSSFEIESFTTARFIGSIFFPVIETISVVNGRKIVWCKGLLARLICWTGDRIGLSWGNNTCMKTLGGSWFFKIKKTEQITPPKRLALKNLQVRATS
jgi:ubiquinone/menaquinone biosynthesis C-methylase UbiE